MTNWAQYIGLPYKDKGRGPDAWDCYGLCKAILAAEAGVILPDYADAYTAANDQLSVSQAVQAGLEHGWTRVTKPQAFDLLILRIAGRPWHCAIMLNERQFLHVPPPSRTGVQQGSCIERLDSPQWGKRIDGFWRYSGDTLE